MNNSSNNKKVTVIGHRGAKYHALENTINSVKKAIVLKADIIELDVRITKDNIPIHIHDTSIDRTTNGKGKVKYLTLKEIKKYNTNGEKIPTLNQILKTFKNQKFNFDIKELEAIIPTIKIIYKNNAVERVIISSRNLEVLKTVKSFNPKIETALICWHPFFNHLKKAKKFKFNALNTHYLLVTEKLIKEAHKNNIKVNVWPLDDLDKIERMIKKGVDGIFTGDPSLIKGIHNGG